MKKHTLLRIITVAVLNVLVIFSSVTSFAAAKPPFIDVAKPNWTHLLTCALLFEKTDMEYVIALGGTTSTHPNVYSYTYISLQQLNNGRWKEIMHFTDLDKSYSGYDGDQIVPKGYTYRLVVTHEARDDNGKVLETHVQTSDNTITYL